MLSFLHTITLCTVFILGHILVPWLITCALVLSMLNAVPQYTQDVYTVQAQCVYWGAAKFPSRSSVHVYTGLDIALWNVGC